MCVCACWCARSHLPGAGSELHAAIKLQKAACCTTQAIPMSETPKKLQAIDKPSCENGMLHVPSIFAFVGSMVGFSVVGEGVGFEVVGAGERALVGFRVGFEDVGANVRLLVGFNVGFKMVGAKDGVLVGFNIGRRGGAVGVEKVLQF